MLEGKNVTYAGGMTIEGLGTFPLYEITEPSLEEYTRKAIFINRRSFEYFHGRPPVSDDEAMQWAEQLASQSKKELQPLMCLNPKEP